LNFTALPKYPSHKGRLVFAFREMTRIAQAAIVEPELDIALAEAVTP
jgi:hypothetical protein